MRRGIASIRQAIFLIEIADLRIASPVSQSPIFPWIGNVQETIAKAAIATGGQIIFGDPQQGMRCGPVGHRQWLKVKSFSLGTLSEHFPIVADRIRGGHRALDHRIVELIWPVESAEKSVR